MNKRSKIYVIKLNKKILLLLAFIILFTIAIINLRNSKSLNIFNDWNENLIVIDPGHGGIDGGAGEKNDILEKDINLEISLKLKKELLVEGFNVIMTREKDESLEDLSKLDSSRYRRDLDARRNTINDNEPLVFISMHCNSSTKSSAKGIKVYTFPDSDEGEKLAKSICQSIDEILYKNFLKEDNLRSEVLSEDYFILRETKYPGVLVEVGFISNAEENKLLQDEEYQQKLALAIKRGILNYLKR